MCNVYNDVILTADVHNKKSINDDDIFSRMLCACEGVYNIIDILESDYNELTNIDVYTKYDIRKFIRRLASDTVDLKSLLEDCKSDMYDSEDRRNNKDDNR